MIDLRPYQLEAINAINETFKHEFTQYIELPTGSGKTFTFLSYVSKNYKNVLVIVPSKQLLNQVYESALSFYHHEEISRKGNNYNEPIKKMHICIINSIQGDYLEFLSQRKFDLIVIDEAHHCHANSYKRFIKKRSQIFHEIENKILGVTATPDRADGLMLKNLLGVCSYKLLVQDLISQGYLCDIEGFSVKTNIDISEIDNHNGDFSLNNLFNKLCTASRNKMIIDIYIQEMKERKTIIFCINVKHSKEINNLLCEKGISSCHIDGSMNSNIRNEILKSFREGKYSVICNCQLLTEGFDEPSIDGMILARPTCSKTLFTQMVGRGLRLFPDKVNCKIIDVVDNHKNLSGWNSLLEDVTFTEINSFKRIKDIQDHLSKEKLKVTEFTIARTDFFDENRLSTSEAVPSMIEYLDNHNIYYHFPLSFDEGSFLVWHNELKKEYNVCH